MSLILALKVIHVIAAIVAVGANVTYALWLNRAKHDPAHLTFALRGIKSLDTFVANPAYVVLGVTGPAMVLAGAFSFTQGWIIVSLVLYVVVAVLGIAVFAPALRRQAAEAERDPTSASYLQAERRTTLLGALTTAVALVIVVLMVSKPF